jgi:hypothetical protein
MIAVSLVSGGTASAAEAQRESYSGLAAVAPERLRDVRGGIMIAGIDLEFGASVRVLVDGTIVAETILTLNPDGSISQTTTIADSSGALPFDPADTGGVEISGIAGASGITIKTDDGVTLALFDINLDHTRSFLINTAAGQDVAQLVDVSLVINNFADISANLAHVTRLQSFASLGVPDAMLGF